MFGPVQINKKKKYHSRRVIRRNRSHPAMRPMEGLAARVFFLILDGGSVSPIRPMPERFDSCGVLDLLLGLSTLIHSSSGWNAQPGIHF